MGISDDQCKTLTEISSLEKIDFNKQDTGDRIRQSTWSDSISVYREEWSSWIIYRTSKEIIIVLNQWIRIPHTWINRSHHEVSLPTWRNNSFSAKLMWSVRAKICIQHFVRCYSIQLPAPYFSRWLFTAIRIWSLLEAKMVL